MANHLLTMKAGQILTGSFDPVRIAAPGKRRRRAAAKLAAVIERINTTSKVARETGLSYPWPPFDDPGERF